MAIEHFNETTGKIHGYVVEQTIYGYGVRELARGPWSTLWTQVGFHEGFDSRSEAAEAIAQMTGEEN